ncbi:DNA-binding response OmpR family regulator [Clostridium sardiniense]|nr:DNA-binding response OmpR family regulator [Clostridium sardiniense]
MRVKVVLRREKKIIERKKELGFYIDIESRSVVINSKGIDLNRKEFDLLYFLYKNKNRVFSRSELLDKVWGIGFEGEDRTVDVHIRRIRSKLGEYKDSSKIETIFGVGYVMR